MAESKKTTLFEITTEAVMYTQEKDVDWLTKENIMSCMKLFFALVAIVTTVKNCLDWATGMIILFVVCDVIDGPLAQKRPFWKPVDDIRRRRFDNVCDVVLPAIICVCVLVRTNISLLWFVPLFVRETMIALLAITALRRTNAVVFPNVAHKIAKLLLALAGVMVLNQWYSQQFLLIAYAALYLTLFDYYGLFKALIPHGRKTEEPQGLHPEVLAGLAFLVLDQKPRFGVPPIRLRLPEKTES